jgi:predicted SnoaL-like aldol condensation-catalyzing enzyme
VLYQNDDAGKELLKGLKEGLGDKVGQIAAERFWSSNYIQHSAHIPPGREGLFNMIKGLPESLRYENGLMVANGDYVVLHGQFSGIGLPVNWIVADIVRLENGKLAEHWDVSEKAGLSQRPAHVRRQVSCVKAAPNNANEGASGGDNVTDHGSETRVTCP